MKKICFATNNENKLKEIKALLSEDYEVVSLKEIGCQEELPETQNTIEGNAEQKAVYVFQNYQVACFADDTGLLIDSLNGEPGVYSARYAGPKKDSEDNMSLVLEKLKDVEDRNAHFKTVVCYVDEHGVNLFEGIAEGSITKEREGAEGFGYDPIFKPFGYENTFAQMPLEEKNKISHRTKAVKKLIDHLSN